MGDNEEQKNSQSGDRIQWDPKQGETPDPRGILEPWSAAEYAKWREEQYAKAPVRSYEQDVVAPSRSLAAEFNQNAGVGAELIEYAQLTDNGKTYPGILLRIGEYDEEKPSVFIQGATHGYEPSGVRASLEFMKASAANYADKFNIFVLPCTSPWGYETDNRWNSDGVDVNRGFVEDSKVKEARAIMDYMHGHYPKEMEKGFLAHISLHEAPPTRDAELEAIQAEAKGEVFEGPTPIPDGFFLIADVNRNNPEIERHIIQAVGEVTHVASEDENGEIYGKKIEQKGVIHTDIKGIDALFTNPHYAFTTEANPESSKLEAGREEVIRAQVKAIETALDHLNPA